MRLWLRIRRLKASIVVVIALGVILIFIGDTGPPFPSLLGGGMLSVPLVLMLPLAIAIVLAYGLAAGDPVLEAIAVRGMLSLDVLFVLAVTGMALAVSTAMGMLITDRLYLAAGRNSVGYVGLMLVGRRFIGGQAAPVVAVAFAFIAALFGSHVDQYRHTYVWAWPLADATEPLSWCLAVGTLIIGIALALSRPVTQTE